MVYDELMNKKCYNYTVGRIKAGASVYDGSFIK